MRRAAGMRPGTARGGMEAGRPGGTGGEPRGRKGRGRSIRRGTGRSGGGPVFAAGVAPAPDVPATFGGGHRAHAPFRRGAALARGRKPVLHRRPRPRRVRGPERPRRGGPARRARPLQHGGRGRARTVPCRGRTVERQAGAGRWSRGRRHRGAGDSARTPARAAGGRGRTGRAHHARADPASRGPDRARQRAGAGRARRVAAAAGAAGLLRRNGYPHTVLDVEADPQARALLGGCALEPADLPLVLCPRPCTARAG